jgi:hypothetical protein
MSAAGAFVDLPEKLCGPSDAMQTSPLLHPLAVDDQCCGDLNEVRVSRYIKINGVALRGCGYGVFSVGPVSQEAAGVRKADKTLRTRTT